MTKPVTITINHGLETCDCVCKSDDYAPDPTCPDCKGEGVVDYRAAFWALAEAEGKVFSE